MALGSLLLGLLVLGWVVLVLRPSLPSFKSSTEPRFELKQWRSERSTTDKDHYGFLLVAPDRVERKLACDLIGKDGVKTWSCSCSEAGKVTRTTTTGKLKPRTAVEIADRAQELCGWPFYADCPSDAWLACMLMDR